MKKAGKIIIGVSSGLALMGAIFGAMYGLNTSVRNWVDNAIVKINNDIPEKYKDVTIESKLELTTAQSAAQGFQELEEVDPEFKLKFALKSLPTDFDGDATLVTKVVSGNPENVYFKVGTAKSFNSVTHANGSDFSFFRKAFENTNKSEKYIIKTYWAEYPDIFINTEVTFKSDFDNQSTNPMTMLNVAGLPRSFADQNGLQIYSDTPAYALLAPKVTNRKSSIPEDALIGNKIVYGDATKVTWENVTSGQSGPIAICKSGDLINLKHTLFTETNKVENYVVRSYLIQDETYFVDTNITFKSDFEANSEKDTDDYEVSFEVDEDNEDYPVVFANNSNKAEVELECVSDDIDQPVYLRVVGADDAPVAKITVGTKVYRSGIAEVEDGDPVTITWEAVPAAKTLTYKMQYVSLQDQNVITTETITVKGKDVTRSAPRLAMPKRAVVTSNGTKRTTTLTATLEPSNATCKTIEWSVSGSGITLSANSTESGNPVTITANAPFDGEIFVIAKASLDYSITSSCSIVYEA